MCRFLHADACGIVLFGRNRNGEPACERRSGRGEESYNMKTGFRRALGLLCVITLLLCAAVSLAEETAEAPAAEATTEQTAAGEENAEEKTDAAAESEDESQEETEQKEETPTWLSQLVKRLGKTTTEAWIAFGALIAMFFVLKFAIGSAPKWNATMVSYGALSIALAFILSYIRLPVSWSGSITPGSMLPIMFFAANYGIGPGIVAGLVYGLLQFLQKPEFLNAWQFILDYLLAFSALGLAGLAKVWKRKGGLFIAITLASMTRMVCAILAGVMWAYDSLGEGWDLAIEVFGTTRTFSPWPYSIVYNALYMIPETVICVLLAVFLAKPLMRSMKGKTAVQSPGD